jgi:hypothetical protein
MSLARQGETAVVGYSGGLHFSRSCSISLAMDSGLVVLAYRFVTCRRKAGRIEKHRQGSIQGSIGF